MKAARFTTAPDGSIYAVVTIINDDFTVSIDDSYKPRYFRTQKAAIISTEMHITETS